MAESIRGRGRSRGRVIVDPDQLPGQNHVEVNVVAEAVSDMSLTCKGAMKSPPSECSSLVKPSVGSGVNGDGGEEPKKGLRVTINDGFIKQGKGGQEMRVMTNYLYMNKTPDFQLYQYRVDFSPEEDLTDLKKMLLRTREADLGSYIFDGHMLYTPRPVPLDKRELEVGKPGDNAHFRIIIKSVGFVLPDSPMYIQFYNMVMRKCMTLIGMEEVGRFFYDRHSSIQFPENRLELWPGMITAIRNHEVGMLLCIEVTHKVLRMETVYDMIQGIKNVKKNQRDFEEAVRKALIGVIVITHYNRMTNRSVRHIID